MISGAKPGSFLTQVTDWSTGITYALYQYVYYSGNLYRCTTAHTSTSFPANIANWLALNSSAYTSMDIGMVIALS